MEKSMSAFKRLLAMLLVFAMVIGYMPAFSFATDAVEGGEEDVINAATEVTPFVVTVTRAEYKEAEPETPEDPTEETTEDPTEETTEDPTEETTEDPTEETTEDPTEDPTEETTEDPTEETIEDPTEETTEESPVEPLAEESEEPTEPELAYTYTAALEIGNQLVDAADVVFAWAYGQNGEFKAEGAELQNVSDDYKELVLKCTYDGITLTGTVKDAQFVQNPAVEIRLSAQMDPGQVKLGAAVAAPEEATTQNFAGKWVVTEWNADYVIDGYVVKAAEGEVRLAKLQLQGQAAEGEEPVVYLETDWNATIVPVVFTASIDVEEGQREWYNAVNAVVTVTGDVPVKDSSFVTETILIDDAPFTANWTTKDNGKSWQSDKISLTESHNYTVAVGKTKYEFNVDTVQPTVKIEEAYYTTINGEEVTVIKFNCTVGESGVEKITIYDGDAIVEDNIDPEATSITVPGWIANPKVIVQSKNGLASEVIPVPQHALTVAVEGPAADTVLGTIGDKVYAPNGALTVVVQGAAQDGDYKLDIEKSVITAKDENGADIEVGEWAYADGKWTATVSLANGLSELAVNVTDAKGRTASASCEQKYGVDREAPVITASRDIEPVNTQGNPGDPDYVEYYDSNVTYSFKIEDLLLGDAESSVTYQLEGQAPVKATFNDKGEASVTVENGQKLTSLTVYGCDASGNLTRQVNVLEGNGLSKTWVADMGLTYKSNVIVDTVDPVVTAEISDNIVAFFTDTNGSIYAVLRNKTVIDNGTVTGTNTETEKVTLTVTVKDKNLSADCLTAEGAAWELSFDENEGIWVAVAKFEIDVDQHSSNVLNYSFSYCDLAKRTSDAGLPLDAAPTKTEGLASGITMNAQDGRYAGQLHIDRRTPSSIDELMPKIVITPDEKLFNGAVTFNMEVYDRSNESTDSGIRYVGWQVSDKNGVAQNYQDGGNFNATGNLGNNYSIPVTLKQENGESNVVTLKIWVKDHVLNEIKYTKTFGIDTKDPVISYSFDNNAAADGKYYNAARTFEATVTDLNLKDAKLIVNGNTVRTYTAESGTITFDDYVINQNGVYKIEIVATDLLGNTSTETIDEFIIDQTVPEIHVTKTLEENKGLTRSSGGFDYYNGEVTYTVTIADEYLSAVSGEKNVAVLTYTVNGTANTVELGENTQWNAIQYLDGKTYYQYEFTLQNDQVLNGMTVQAVDNAGNVGTFTSAQDAADAQFQQDENGVWNYTGNAVVVDKVAPVITITKNVEEPVHSYKFGEKTYDYYNDEVAYTITITDNFMSNAVVNENNQFTNIAVYSFLDDQGNPNRANLEMTEKVDEESGKNVMTITIPVSDGQVLETIQFSVQDNAGNLATFTTANGADTAHFVKQSTGAWSYNGNPIVVDTTAPTAELRFSSNVDSFYTNGNTVYVVLKAPVTGDSGVISELLSELVTMTLTVNDRNLVIDNNDTNGVKDRTEDGFAWEGETSINKSTTLSYTANSGEVNPDGTRTFQINVQISDLAGHTLTQDKLLVIGAKAESGLGENKPVVNVTEEKDEEDNVIAKGVIAFDVAVDRRRPTSGNDTDVPVITIEPELPEGIDRTATASGLDLFDGAFNFKLRVTDGEDSTDNSGVKYVNWTLDDGIDFVVDASANLSGADLIDALDENGNYTIPVELSKEIGESNNVKLTIQAMDNVGNLIEFEKTFGVDTQIPGITPDFGENDPEPVDGYYYSGQRVLNVTVTDINLANAKLIVNGNVVQDVDAQSGEIVFEPLVITQGGVYNISIVATDLAGHSDTVVIDEFAMDQTAPVVTVTKGGAELFDYDDAADYHNGEVTYTVTISDAYLKALDTENENQVQVAEFTYTLEDGTPETISLDPAVGGWNYDDSEGQDVYSFDLTLENGNVLTDMTIRAVDNAGNPMEAVIGVPFDDEEKDGTWNYNGRDVVVDTIAPEITVIRTVAERSSYVNTHTIDGVDYDYYNGAVTYKITVTDSFLNAGTTEKLAAKVIYTDGSSDPVELELVEQNTENSSQKHADLDTYSGSFTLDGTKVMESIEIDVADNAGNAAVFPTAEANDFELIEGVWAYTGNPIVVDTTAPTAKIFFNQEVDSFYMNGNTIYAVLTDRVEGNSGAEINGTQSVTVTIEVTDNNLVIDNNDEFGVKNDTDGIKEDTFGWTGPTGVNTASTIKYVAESAEVSADGKSAVFTIDAQVIDLAGHALTNGGLEIVGAKAESGLGEIKPVINVTEKTDEEGNVIAKGVITFDVVVDRRRPTSSGDAESVPTITIEPVLPEGIERTATASGIDLFNGAFNFALHVTDGEDSADNSGLNYVKWTVADKNGVVTEYVNTVTYKDENGNVIRTLSDDYLIEIPLNVEYGESNDVVLTIEAMDNVGNLISFEETFGVDNLTPRVTITQSNKDVHDRFYFKDDQVITVEIEDLNFDPDASSVDTQVDFNGWKSIGDNKYTTVLTYNTNGVYDFAMGSTDLANNEAVIDYITDLVALQHFIIDKDAPEVTVTKGGAALIDSDTGADYHSDKVTYTVKISDAWLDNVAGATQVAEFIYTLEDGTVETVSLPASEDGWSYTENEDQDVYSYVLTLDNGDVLTDMTIRVVDNAGNPMEAVIGVPFADEDKDGIWRYTGRDVVVDMVTPVITVTKDQVFVHQYTFGEVTYDYYDAEVTYTITVTDNFLNAGTTEKLEAEVTYTDGSSDPVELTTDDSNQKHADLDTYTGSFKLDGTKVMESIEIDVADNAGNAAVFPTAEANDFKLIEGVWAYKGNPIVVDKTAPEATISFSKNVDSFYMKGDTIYAVLTDPVVGDSGAEIKGTQRVTVTIEVTDNNLVIDNNDDFGVKAGTYRWTGTTAVNTASTIKYVAESAEVAADGTAVFTIDVQVVDLAGNYLPADRVTVTETENTNGLGATVPEIPAVVDGKIAFDVNVDRRRSTSGDAEGVPTITINPSIKPTETASGIDLFNGAFNFALHVNDGQDSGINYVDWTLEDANGFVIKNTKLYSNTDEKADGELNANGDYTIPVKLNQAENESNDVKLTIKVMDNSGNKILFVKNFGVDTLKPRIAEYVYTYGDAEAVPTNGNFYNKDVTVTVTIEDLNMDEGFKPEDFITITKYTTIPDLSAGKELPVESVWAAADLKYVRVGDSIVYTFSMTFEEDGVYGVTTTLEDLANNAYDRQAQDNVFILDKTAPVVNVTKTVEEGKDLIHTANGVDYHNGEVTYTVTIADEFLSAVPGEVNVAVLTYTFEDGTTETVSLAEGLQWNVFEYMDGMTYYQHEFTVKNDQVLTDMTLKAVDNANNPMTEVLGDAPFADEDKDGIWTYTGNDVAVDKVAPVITVEKVGNRVHTYDGYDYFDDEVTYTITVKDNFMNDGVAEHYVKYSIRDDQGVTTVTNEPMSALAGEGKLVSEDTYSYTFTIVDGQVLENIEFLVKDNADNVATFDSEKAAAAVQFEQQDEAWVHSGNPFVVDMTAPEAQLSFSDNVASFYTNGSTVYVVLKDPVVGDNTSLTSGGSSQEVTMILTVTDRNLAIDNSDVNGIKDRTEDGFAWAGETPVNIDGTTVTYVAKSGNVNPDGTHTFEIDVQMLDLAGHKLQKHDSDSQQKLELVPANGNVLLGGIIPKVDVNDNGDLKFTVSTDRLRPTSEDDTTAPTITVNPSIEPNTTADGLDLFNGAFNFALHVTDGDDNALNSGINYVKWTVEDPNGVVRGYETLKPYADEEGNVDRVLTQDYVIDIPLNVAHGESNEVKLTIEAMDNVGNLIVFEKTFGVDNLNPRVTITQSNHSVENDFYFKDDQIVTVVIEDLNFEPTTSTVTTEVGFNGWESIGGNKYRTVLTYNRDGDYTFAMQTTDRANNAAVIDYTTGLTALQKFTIDKTAPIINVDFSPATAIDKDPEGVQYFDKNRSVTVTITEHNFRASDVVSDLGAKNALGAWRSNGDTHTAGDMFNEGNRYKVSVQYTDLAGNPAEAYTSPTFSVDLGAPTIEMTKGSMKDGQVNIVPDELVLAFTIHDAQSNLKNHNIEVMFLDSSFVPTKVEGEDYYVVTGQGDDTNVFIDFTNIKDVKANDGIYTVRISAVDYAGHVTVMSDKVFSLNRFGSTFRADVEYTTKFLTANDKGIVYHNDVEEDLVITEINPNRVWQDAEKTQEGSLITVSVNGKAVTLKAGEDYQLAVEEMGTTGHKWYEYTYTISKDIFRSGGELVDGEYTIFFYSEDEAANKNTNEANEGSALTQQNDGNYNRKIAFTLDHKEPVVTILGIEDGQDLYKKNHSVEINLSDNTPVTIEVYINDVLVDEIETIAGQDVASDWLYYDKDAGTYKLNMSEKRKPQNVRIVVKDAAGNVVTAERNDIMLTENLWYQYINNTTAKFVTIVILLALFMLIMVLIKKRKQKKEAEAAAAAKN